MSQDEHPSAEVQPAIPPGIQLHLEAGDHHIRELGIDEDLVQRTVDRAAAQLERKPSWFTRLAAVFGRPFPLLIAMAAAAFVGVCGQRLFAHSEPVTEDGSAFYTVPWFGSRPWERREPATGSTFAVMVHALPLGDRVRTTDLMTGPEWRHGDARELLSLSRSGEKKLRDGVADCTKNDRASVHRLCVVQSPAGLAFTDAGRCSPDGPCNISMALDDQGSRSPGGPRPRPERPQGLAIPKECLDNPFAKGCS